MWFSMFLCITWQWLMKLQTCFKLQRQSLNDYAN